MNAIQQYIEEFGPLPLDYPRELSAHHIRIIRARARGMAIREVSKMFGLTEQRIYQVERKFLKAVKQFHKPEMTLAQREWMYNPAKNYPKDQIHPGWAKKSS